MQIEQRAGDRRADHGGQWNRRHEVADDARPVHRGIPEREVEDDAGEEARLGRAQQHADQIEGVLVAHPGGAGDVRNERHGARENAPAQHDAGDPFARAEPLEQQVGWHLEDEIGDEEDAGAEAERGLRQAEVGVHRQRGEADIDAVQIGDEVAEHQEGDEPPRDLRDRPDFHFVHVTAPDGGTDFSE